MKTIGLIGGLGPESTLDYYRGIIDAFTDGYKENGYPEIVIQSVNLKQFVDLADANRWDRVTDILADRFERLRMAGADFGAIASNTPHRVFDAVRDKTTLPLISIVEAACRQARAAGLARLGLLGTRFTMQSDFYTHIFSASGIQLVTPEAADQDYIQDKLFSEIELGIVKDETRQGFREIAGRLAADGGVEGIILGCTELPLVLQPDAIPGACLDTTRIHVDAIVSACRA